MYSHISQKGSILLPSVRRTESDAKTQEYILVFCKSGGLFDPHDPFSTSVCEDLIDITEKKLESRSYNTLLGHITS
jgi:hypothetical protein